MRTYVNFSELGEGRSQCRGNSQHAVLHVHQSTHAVIDKNVRRVQVTKKYTSVMEEL